MEYNQELMRGFLTLQNCTEGYLPQQIDVINAPIESMVFLRKYISKSNPVIIRGAMGFWSTYNWLDKFKSPPVSDKEVSVGVSPTKTHEGVVTEDVIEDGRLSRRELFLSPDVRKMKFKDLDDSFLKNSDSYFQLSEESSSLWNNFPTLFEDCNKKLKWADEAFGRHPDQINLMMRSPAIVTGVHQTQEENLFCIAHGEANYCLYPPTDRPRLLHKKYKQGKYVEVNGKLVGSLDAELPGYSKTCVDEQPVIPFSKRYRKFKQSTPIKVCVRWNEVLYVPYLWFVKGEASTFYGVNVRYRGEHDIKRAYYKFLDQLCEPYVKNNDQ